MRRMRPVFAATVLLSALAMPLWAAPASQLGIVVFADHARIGMAPASVGSTVFAGDKVSTELPGSVQIRAGAARFLLASGSVATLSSDETAAAATLISGTATFSTSNSKAFTLHFANAAIRPNTDEPTVGQVSIAGPRELVVKSNRGSLAFTVENETRVVTEGTAYRVILNPTPAEVASASHTSGKAADEGAQRAGEISRVIPEVNISRGGQTLSASANFVVDWQDQINTTANARARVGLDDGSVLNVGSDSLMRVVKHDAGAQQTELELTYGKLRSRAQKIAKPGGKFEVHTGAGIAGVVGTDFYIGYADDVMNVLVFEGLVRVCNLAGVCVLVKAGEMTSLHKNDNTPPPPPVPAPLSLMTSVGADTDAGGDSAIAAPTASSRQQKSDNRSSSKAPVGAGSSKFVWYAVGVVAIVTVVAITHSYESPDHP
jgi:FecR protein